MCSKYQLNNRLNFFMFLLNIDYLLNVLKTSYVHAIKFQDSFNTTKVIKHSSEIFQLVNSSSAICIFAEDKEITSIFIDSIHWEYIPRAPFIINNQRDKLSVCSCNIILEMKNLTNCNELFFGFKKSSIYFLNSHFDINITTLGNCLHNSSSPEVVVLVNGSIFELSQFFRMPRRFNPSSINDVKQHRKEKCKLDLEGVEVAVAYMNYPPFSIFPNLDKPEEGDGIEFLLVKELSRQLNFTIKYKVGYKYWGFLRPNGTWHGGGIGQVMQERKADLVVADIWQIPSYYAILDFGPSLKRNSLAFLVRRPVKIDFQWRVVATIFEPPVWICTLAAFAVVVVVYHICLLWDLRPRNQSWAASVLTIFGHFTMATSTTPAPTGSPRPLLTAWSLFALLLTTFLSTGIVTRLTLPLYSPRVDTNQQMVEGGFYWTHQFYKKFETAEIKNMIFDFNDPWSRELEKRYVYMDEEEVKQAIKRDKKISLPVQTNGDFFVINTKGAQDQTKLRDFRLTKQVVQGCHQSWGVKKHSPLLRPFTVITHRFIQAGLYKHWKDEVVRRWPLYDISHTLIELDVNTLVEPEPLKLSKIQPIFLFLAFGLAVSSLVFFLEMNW